MKITITGRIREWFLSDLRTIRDTIRNTEHGLWSIPVPGPGRPRLFRLPCPHHPLEVIAALRGWGGLETPEDTATMFRDAAVSRASGGWEGVTRRLADRLFVPPQTVRFMWHVLTPIWVPPNPRAEESVAAVRATVYDTLGLHRGPLRSRSPHPRHQFWTDDLNGRIDL